MHVTFDPMNPEEVAVVRAMIAADSPTRPTVEAEKPTRRPRRKKSATPDPVQVDIEDVVTPEPEPEVVPEPDAQQSDDTDGVTIDDLRTAFTAYVQGKAGTAGALEMLKKFGVKRVSDLPQDRYAEFIGAISE